MTKPKLPKAPTRKGPKGKSTPKGEDPTTMTISPGKKEK